MGKILPNYKAVEFSEFKMGMKALLLATFVLSLAITVANASVGLAVYHTHNTR